MARRAIFFSLFARGGMGGFLDCPSSLFLCLFFSVPSHLCSSAAWLKRATGARGTKVKRSEGTVG